MGTHAAAASSSQRQRKPYPSSVLLSSAPSSSVGGTAQARPSSETRRNPALVAAPRAKAAAPNDAEDLWEDLCRTLREL